MKPSQKIVESTLAPHKNTLNSIVLDAWEEWKGSSERMRCRFPRTGRSIMFERLVDRALAEFSSISGIKPIEGHETIHFLFADQVLVRFKYAGRSRISSNVNTQLSLSFHDHENQLTLFPDFHKVDLIYQLDLSQTEISDIRVVARQGDKLLWDYSIFEAQESDSVLEMPIEPDQPRDTKRLVKVKGNQQETGDQRK